MKPEELKPLYREMLLIRRAEETLQKLFNDGEVPGFLHLSIGQEAVPTGVSHCLRDSDTVSSNHRGHGHTLAKGVDLTSFFAEILGRVTGLCKGRGGSMHVADLSLGMLGANGIVGAGLPITTGSALALKIQGKGDVAVVYFGDGALAEGIVHECLNISALWQLPVVFVCENNGWSEFSPTEKQLATNLEKLAKAFGIKYASVDGNKVDQVANTAARLINPIRKSPSPVILECNTTRIRGHYEGDKQDYREDAELKGLETRDPIFQTRKDLESGGTDPSWFKSIAEDVETEINSSITAAKAAPLPETADIMTDVYTNEGR